MVKSLGIAILLATMFFLSACGMVGSRLGVLDAARIYSESPSVFELLRTHFESETGGRRVIQRWQPNDTRPEDMPACRLAQRSVGAKRITASSNSGDGLTSIDVTLRAYGLGVSGRTIGVIYSTSRPAAHEPDLGVAVFEQCDERVSEWLASDRETSFVLVYCHIEENWYAYQYSN